jgi:hypothetical protein
VFAAFDIMHLPQVYVVEHSVSDSLLELVRQKVSSADYHKVNPVPGVRVECITGFMPSSGTHTCGPRHKVADKLNSSQIEFCKASAERLMRQKQALEHELQKARQELRAEKTRWVVH